MGTFFPALAVAILSVSTLSAEPFAPIQPFLDRYCVDCHGPKKQKADVRLDDFKVIDGALWVDIYDHG